MYNKLSYKFIDNSSEEVVVFLHGWGLSGDSFGKIISRLDNSKSILVVDLFGFGGSPQPQDYFDTYEYAYQIFLLIKKLCLSKIVLVGHSFGGRLSILLSSVFNVNVKTLVLCASAGLNRFTLIRWIKIKKYKLIKWCVSKKILSQSRLEKYGSVDYVNSNKVLRGVLSRVVNQDLRKWIARIHGKCVLIWDAKDRETPYWICKKINKILKVVSVIKYTFGGHFAIFYNIDKFSNLINKL